MVRLVVDDTENRKDMTFFTKFDIGIDILHSGKREGSMPVLKKCNMPQLTVIPRSEFRK